MGAVCASLIMPLDRSQYGKYAAPRAPTSIINVTINSCAPADIVYLSLFISICFSFDQVVKGSMHGSVVYTSI